MNAKLAQLAHQAISDLKSNNRDLESQINRLSDEVETIKVANELGFKLAKFADMQVDDLETKLSELYSKSLDELKVLEKAAELSLDSDGSFSLGSISDRPSDDGTLDPLTSFLLESF